MSRKNIVGGKINKPNKGNYGWAKDALLHSVEGWLSCVDLSVNEKISIVEVRYVEKAKRTIVTWDDGTKTVAKCHPDDKFDRCMGLAICVLKKLMTSNEYHALFNNWAVDGPEVITLSDVKDYVSGKGMIYSVNGREVVTMKLEPTSFVDSVPEVYANNNCNECGFKAAV